MPPSKKEVRAGHALARVRRLAALPEPKRTSSLIAHAKRIRRQTLIALVNAMAVDRFVPRKPRVPSLPKSPSPEWALDLPLEFLAIICRRLWPAQFRHASTRATAAKTGTIGDRIKLLAARRQAGAAMWNEADVLKNEGQSLQVHEERPAEGRRRGPQRELDGTSPTPSERRPRDPRIRSVSSDTIDDEPTEESDQQLVHEWLCMYVYGKEASKSWRELRTLGPQP